MSENPGLQILLRDENEGPQWMDVPPAPLGTFVVNLGDMLERWTNGKFKSTMHRVLIPSYNGKEQAQERYSIPFFFDPQFDAIVECLESCLETDEVAKYPVITSGEHLLSKYHETHADFAK